MHETVGLAPEALVGAAVAETTQRTVTAELGTEAERSRTDHGGHLDRRGSRDHPLVIAAERPLHPQHPPLELRGEWIDGQPFDRMHTRGGYLDAFVHRREMGPFSAMARIEVLDYDAGKRSVLAKRATIGTRIHLVESLYAQVNLSHQLGALYAAPPTSTDVAVTYTLRYPR